jgi:hypothetical protein
MIGVYVSWIWTKITVDFTESSKLGRKWGSHCNIVYQGLTSHYENTLFYISLAIIKLVVFPIIHRTGEAEISDQ